MSVISDHEAELVPAGPSEGVFGWVAANYASGALQGYALRQGLRLRKSAQPPAPFVGVFELGGASAQVCCLTACRLCMAEYIHADWAASTSCNCHMFTLQP